MVPIQDILFGGRAYDPSFVGNYDYKNWMIKLDPSGTVIWSSLIKPATVAVTMNYGVMDVFERYNPSIEVNDYEYYGASTMDAGVAGTEDTLIVWRLDVSGTANGVGPNEFKYPMGDGIGNTDFSAQIECVGDGSNAGDGFGAWTTDLPLPADILYKNYFNGVNGCTTTIAPITVYQGPGFFSNPSASPTTFNNDCQNVFSIDTLYLKSATPCFNTTVAGGGNRGERAAKITGLTQPIKNLETTIYPNPVSDKIVIELSAETKNCSIKIENALGQTVYQATFNIGSANGNEVNVDFEKLNLSGGTYYLTIDTGLKKEVQKLVYIK
ncbi:MAG: T9SS type A sorting domain-containing protein [bacterium]|nr:T9SS type A sorting domain-containing protein [bacterium]